MKTLVLDNYDSFTYNLYQYVAELGGNPVVHRNNKITLSEVRRGAFSHLIISPGPGNPYTPRDIGISEGLIDYAAKERIPLLGVCLGHQVLAKHFGARVARAPEIFHGKASVVAFIEPRGRLFQRLPKMIDVMRYHSLCAESAPEGFRITASTSDAPSKPHTPHKSHHPPVIMALEHNELSLFGIQFHPESIGTPEGKAILRNFLSLAP